MKHAILFVLTTIAIPMTMVHADQSMDQMWGDAKVQPGIDKTDRAGLFRDGNYGMFIHWGLFSHLGGQWHDQTFYGIGEWKFATQAGKWTEAGKATWAVDVCEAGDYRLDLTYKGEGRLVWKIETDEGATLQNQQNSSPVYHAYPMGLLTFRTPGKHTIAVSLVEGDRQKASLEAVRLSPAE